MTGLKTLISRFCKEESGQSTTEYILILVLVLMIFNKVKGKVVQIIEGSTTKLDSGLTDAMKFE
ncbi:MAG: Flp family type IVb pilin [Proteobacteria bacterium]|nr:MAG: Flp family type IVb pilin [Pseudomonadota bacterium]